MNSMGFTRGRYICTIAPLYRRDKSIATYSTEQAKVLFNGTSVVSNQCDLSDVPLSPGPRDRSFLKANEYEVGRILEGLPNNKAAGVYDVRNKNLKLAKSSIFPPLTKIINFCLSCFGKLFEALLAKRLSHWAETSGALADGHLGGRRQRCPDDAFIILSSWIKHHWCQGRFASGFFLDVKNRPIHRFTENDWYIPERIRV
ncbi:hypothetical protein CROQUDRAFT_96712 [Cronartium quercuum f. sp. fusiforme G11]|uniref:Uncharacterized protein n=1 Tax=Cronartium quercuum f. sp. fusiforme G11 TaxID=708437 RepID=A0A9P6NF89_9BASI|nr:hypothetical protein CROQUDRAFT_96712 [Cronartium quercuum f. sp. fusiforme G11]